MVVYKCDICGAEYNDKKHLHMIPRKVRGVVIRPLVCNRCVCDFDQTLDKIIEALKKRGK